MPAVEAFFKRRYESQSDLDYVVLFVWRTFYDKLIEEEITVLEEVPRPPPTVPDKKGKGKKKGDARMAGGKSAGKAGAAAGAAGKGRKKAGQETVPPAAGGDQEHAEEVNTGGETTDAEVEGELEGEEEATVAGSGFFGGYFACSLSVVWLPRRRLRAAEHQTFALISQDFSLQTGFLVLRLPLDTNLVGCSSTTFPFLLFFQSISAALLCSSVSFPPQNAGVFTPGRLQILLCIPGQQLRLQLRRWPMPARLKTKCGLPGNVVFGPHTLGYSFTIC